MEFLLLTPEYTYQIPNPTKVKGFLKNGVVEIFEKHQHLIGLIENNLVEIEFGNEKKSFVLQNAIFIVSDREKSAEILNSRTIISIYAKRFFEIGKTNSIEELSLQYEQKKKELALELENVNEKNFSTLNLTFNSKALLIKEDIEFFGTLLFFAKEFKRKEK
jgi:dihydroxyacetone kinase-like predicted kinase